VPEEDERGAQVGEAAHRGAVGLRVDREEARRRAEAEQVREDVSGDERAVGLAPERDVAGEWPGTSSTLKPAPTVSPSRRRRS
jgi:hypothetical protein